jgi:acetyl esterase/lipase
VVREESVAGVQCLIVSSAQPKFSYLHLHGGGFRLGWTRTWLNFASDIALKADCQVVIPDYRLAPEHPFPAALVDAVGVYTELQSEGEVFVGGDSAGGALALSLTLAARDSKHQMPAGLVLLSPWLDLAATAASYEKNASTDTMFSKESAEQATVAYLGTCATTDPLASPAYGDFSRVPKVLIFVSASEVLLDDAVQFSKKAQQSGVAVDLHVVENMPHIWPVIMVDAPETLDARQKIVDFLS